MILLIAFMRLSIAIPIPIYPWPVGENLINLLMKPQCGVWRYGVVADGLCFTMDRMNELMRLRYVMYAYRSEIFIFGFFVNEN